MKNKHTSTLEHSLICFDIEGISRGCLQELARHRIGTPISVESSRYTLKKILNGDKNIKDYLVSSGIEELDELNIKHLTELKKIIKEKNIKNDISKYGIVESYKVNLKLSFNFRSLNNFIELRNTTKAWKEIRTLSKKFIELIPDDYKIFLNL